MGLVGKVIKDRVHPLSSDCIYTYEDLEQIGYLGLCKAALADRPGYETAFSTFAYVMIRNEIYAQLEYATRCKREVSTELSDTLGGQCEDVDAAVSGQEHVVYLNDLLDQAESQATGVTAKGIQAIRLLAMGYSNREIGERFGTTANNVTAWVARARKKLRKLAAESGYYQMG